MVAHSIIHQHYDPHIRKLDLTRDLNKVADLIEMCFPIASDPDGQAYVNAMRKSAREMRLIRWLSQIAEMGSLQASGFVWEENEQIIGNLSLIPYQSSGSRLMMIANVAVHPDHRRQGIANSLTVRTLNYLRRQNVGRVWLQVREDNPPAINLYRSLGFKDRAVRTTWRIRPKELIPQDERPDPHVRFTRRKKPHWPQQKKWLEEAYPLGIRWNFPVNFSRFSPGLLQDVLNRLDGFYMRHWALEYKKELKGLITWQKTDSFANNLWLGISEEDGEKVLPTGLVKVCERLSQRHPLSIDFPAGMFKPVFEGLGFSEFRTLIWMEVIL